ncbi:Amino acid permease [Stylosanthes scabra]|uniref:Amino acid permease n=1 Tax=Stylosanthes scabra TaxID=79078 RepID=A0ABU6ZL22_9FABA|nr:Amino acid permease [Stylosanthes scabra]
MVEDVASSSNHQQQQPQAFDVSVEGYQHGDSKFFDDDGHHKRTGSVWTASAHIITAVIGAGVLSLSWAIAQLGWVAGPAVMILFSLVTYYCSTLLCVCYRTGDPVNGKRNHTYMEAVRSNLENKRVKGSITGISVGTVSESQKVWRTFQSLGNIAFAYSYSMILIEIEDTIKSPPKESTTMKKATFISVVVTTLFYMLCGCFGYAAFGDSSPGNLLTGFGFYNPFWLLDIANAAIVIHLVGAYQVYCQPIFSFVEKMAADRFPSSDFVNKEIKIPIPGYHPYRLNLFRLVWRTIFVIITTLLSMLLPFFNDIVGVLGAVGFWPITVYFPVEMYIVQKKIPKWSTRWVCLHMLSFACLMVSVVAAAGSVAGIIDDVKVYKPFRTNY